MGDNHRKPPSPDFVAHEDAEMYDEVGASQLLEMTERKQGLNKKGLHAGNTEQGDCNCKFLEFRSSLV